MPRKDFTQTALDVVRQATGETPKKPAPSAQPQKETASKATKGAVKRSPKSKQ